MVGYDLNDGSIFNYMGVTEPVGRLQHGSRTRHRRLRARLRSGLRIDSRFRNLDWNHFNRQLIQAEAAKRGADESGATED